MIDTQIIRKKIIDLAIRGRLTKQQHGDGSADDLLRRIQAEKALLINEGKLKKTKPMPIVSEQEKPFIIPENWEWARIGDVFTLQSGKNKTASSISNCRDEEHKYCCYGGNGLRGYVSEYNVSGEHVLIGRQGALCGNINMAQGDFYATEHAVVVYTYADVDVKWAAIALKALNLNQYATSVAQPGLAVGKIEKVLIPLPPVPEQKRIAQIIESIIAEADIVDNLQHEYSKNMVVIREMIIDAGIKGVLTNQIPEDGTAKELYKQIQIERNRQEQEKEIKKVELLPDIKDGEEPFNIPDSWMWTRFGNTSYIVRGGSPRPIKQYITDDPDGINWIKIGDVEKGGKYIYETKEKIIPEGEKKSRRVSPGDFLLTNSMSFGRPYISKIDGCIHDGWLLIRNLHGFDDDYLYYLLSSSYMYNEFCLRASGSTVDNLNIEKVSSAFVPLPPIAEQRRIVQRIDELLAALPELKNKGEGTE